jgi:hypothetical protein
MGRLEKGQPTYEEMCQLFLQTLGALRPFAGFLHAGTRMHLGWLLEAREGFETIITDPEWVTRIESECRIPPISGR